MTHLTGEQWISHWKPQFPRAADIMQHGLHPMSREAALTKTHIEVNTYGKKNFIVFDVDDDDALRHVLSLAWDHEDDEQPQIPLPNWITTNTLSGHAHVGYILEDGVTTSEFGRQAPQQYLASIRETLRQRLGADAGYSGAFTRNPLVAPHTTWWGPAQPYTLKQLHEALGTLAKTKKKDAIVVDLDTETGRNQALFAKVRAQSYTIWHSHYLDDESEGKGRLTHEQELVTYALEQNALMFPGRQLSDAQVISTTRSVAAWTWRNFNAEKFSKIQRNRAMLTERVQARQDRIEAIKDTAEAGHQMTAKEISDIFEVSMMTAYDYMREAGFTSNQRTAAQENADRILALRAEKKSYTEIAKELDITVRQVRYAIKKAEKEQGAQAA